MLTHRLENISVILIEPKKAGNIGLIARLCNNFGVKELILVGIKKPIHLSSESRMYAMHSQDYLFKAKVFNNMSELREAYPILIATSARASSSFSVLRQPSFPWELKQLKETKDTSIGVVFGREDSGLTNKELQQCDFLLNIPLPGEHKVLNITHAVAIILYEFWKILSQIEGQLIQHTISTLRQREVLFSLFEDIVSALPYHEYKKPIIIKSFRKVVNRSLPSSDEIDSLIGIFKRIIKNCVDQNASKGT